MRRMVATWLVISSVASVHAFTQTLVDRIVAIVGEQVITLSDVRVAADFGLIGASPLWAAPSSASPPTAPATTVSPAAPGPTPAAGPAGLTDEQLLERLVERELMRAEVERFGAPETAPELIERRANAVRARFASPEAFAAALDAHGLSEGRFQAWLVDDVRIAEYVQQRFGAAAQPTDEDMLQYYQSREREFAAADGRPRPFDDVRDEVWRRLVESRLTAMVDDWVTGLRRRTTLVLKTLD